MCETKNFYLWLLQVIGLLCLLVLCLWLALRPKSPGYTITELSIPTSTNSINGNASSPVADLNGSLLHYTLEIKNPNKDSKVLYDDILLTFYYEQDTVGNSTIPSFQQGKDKAKEVFNPVKINPVSWRALVKATSNATTSIQIKVSLSTDVQYNTWGVKSKRHVTNLQGFIPIGSDGKISGKKKNIKLRPVSKKSLKLRTAAIFQ